MTDFINYIFRWYLKKHYKAIQSHYQNPIALQEEEFTRIITKNSHTVFGKKYAFRQILSKQNFASQVPVHHYEDLWPYIERILQNEQKVLTAEKVIWLAKTAGTSSGKSKYIPITENNLRRCHFRASWYSLATLYAHRKDMKIFAQRNLLLGGGIYGKCPGTNIKVGDISGILIHRIPNILKPFYYPDTTTATLPNYEEKIHRTAEVAALQKNITMLGGVPTWNLALYRLILEKTGAENLLDIWPNLQAYIHGGVRFSPYIEQFKALIPDDSFLYHEVYNASEGYFAIQDQLDKDDLLLLLDNGMYYEFIPFSEYAKNNLTTCSLEDVVPGTPYVLVLSNNSGLYRYVLGDVITFTSCFPFRIKITGRTQEYINAFGEDVQVQQVEKALAFVCQQMNVTISDYTIAPTYLKVKESGFHQWFIEFSKAPDNLNNFVDLLDEQMQLENANYAQKRTNNFAVKPLQIVKVPTGFFKQWLKNKGRVNGQSKIPRLVNDRKIADELLVALEKDINPK